MMSSRTRSAPADRAVFTWSRVSHSTWQATAGQRACAVETASSMASPARWLSLTRMPSDSEPRWLTPPPARTAAFSRARRPGVVLRVSRMRARSPAASTKRLVRVATPDRWPRRLRAVRSAVSTGARGPDTRAITVPGASRSPSARSHSTSMPGSTARNVSAAARRPASTPSARLARTAATIAPAGTRPAVRSPKTPRSSARARATTSRTASAGGSSQVTTART